MSPDNGAARVVYARGASHPRRVIMWTLVHDWKLVGAGLLGVLALYAATLDQGFLISLVQGDPAYAMNLLHEFVHDARHTAAVPCH